MRVRLISGVQIFLLYLVLLAVVVILGLINLKFSCSPDLDRRFIHKPYFRAPDETLLGCKNHDYGDLVNIANPHSHGLHCIEHTFYGGMRIT